MKKLILFLIIALVFLAGCSHIKKEGFSITKENLKVEVNGNDIFFRYDELECDAQWNNKKTETGGLNDTDIIIDNKINFNKGILSNVECNKKINCKEDKCYADEFYINLDPEIGKIGSYGRGTNGLLDISNGQKYFGSGSQIRTGKTTNTSSAGFYVNEEGWKDWRNAKSLKDTGFSLDVEWDEKNNITVKDFNITDGYLTQVLELSSSEGNNVKIKKFTEFYNETTKKINKIEDKSFEQIIYFDNIGDKKIIQIETDAGERFSFGEFSTNTTLKTPDTDIMDDTFVDGEASAQNLNYGAQADTGLGAIVGEADGGRKNIYVRENHTKVANLAPNQIIDNATYYKFNANDYPPGTTGEVTSYHVTNTTWTEGTGWGTDATGAGSDTQTTAVNQPCGTTTSLNPVECNISAMNNRTHPTTDGLWVDWEITQAVQSDFTAAGGDQNSSFMLMAVTADEVLYRGYQKEESTSSGNRNFVEIISSDAPINNAPNATNATIQSLAVNPQNLTNETLIGSFNVSDAEGDNINWFAPVYRNGIEQFTLNGTGTDGTTITFNIESANTSHFERWGFKVIIDDGADNDSRGYLGSDINISIENYAPTIRNPILSST